MERNARYPNLFREGNIGKLKIKNRVVMSPMAAHFGGPFGEVTPKTIDYFARRAKGGAGLIITGGTEFFAFPVSRLGSFGGLSIAEDRFKAGMYDLTEAVHAYGAKIFLQLSHSGRTQSSSSLHGLQPVSSSAVGAALPGEAEVFPVPRALTRGEIYEFIERWAQGALRAKMAGFDGVDLHMAHGTLMTSFISPLFNKRTDEFGGSLENRMRFPMAVVRRIKELCGADFPVSVRFSADEFKEGGVRPDGEGKLIAQMFEQAGADCINISSGLYDNLHLSNDIMRHEEGWKRYIWRTIKEAVKIPVIACGGLRTPEFCETILAEGDADFVGLGRTLIADPDWPAKALEGRSEDIRRCYSCLLCLKTLFDRGAPRCAVNPEYGREKDFGILKPAENPKKVMVIGAGPAGMEAARVAALRGHEVSLYDKNAELGGQLVIAAAPPGKQKMLWLRDYQKGQLEKLGVKIELGKEVTPEFVHASGPDVVIIATGSNPLIPDIPGIRNKNVVTARDVLAKKVILTTQRVIVAGGGMVGLETAEFLLEQGNKVVVVEMLPVIAADMEPLNRQGLLEALQGRDITILTGMKIVEIAENGVLAIDRENNKRFIEGDAVVLALGAIPERSLAQRLKDDGLIPELHIIGDANEPRRVMEAVYEGSLTARLI